MSLTTMRMEELRGTLMLVLEPNFIATMTNSYYGGPAEPPNSKRTEFTDTETRLIELSPPVWLRCCKTPGAT